ncbi:GA4 desaturase family protein [Tothia fuscella]|uniref:GA4 desaturase family protein n=1 Tax=Tothia fuscella TaxID=1048955 RepID=A0A9P4TWH7_9PEZI|nr:GA4 desaturase family protein [Tothia fuscella]
MALVRLNYYLDPSQGGITHYTPGTAGILRRKFDTQEVRIQDLRGQEDKFNFHQSSFQVSKFDIDMEGKTNDEMKRDIYPQAEEFIKKITGASRVVCFSHLIRRDTVESNREALSALEASTREDSPIADNHGFGKVVPARFAHIDQSPVGAYTLLKDNLPEEAETLSKTRWGTTNIWRPLKTIRRDPLALCDSRTLRDEDLAIVESILPPKGSGNGYYDTVSKGDGFQTLEIKANPEHKWYYVSNLMPEECLVFKIHDSKKSIQGRCPHTSFPDLNDEGDVSARENIEFRFFVFYEDQPAE